jgi:cyanophycinase
VAIHLIGGGWDPALIEPVYGQFSQEARAGGGRLVFVLQHGTQGGRFVDLFRGLGLPRCRRVTVGRDRPLPDGLLDDCDALFVCGGVNPLYRSALAPAATAIADRVRQGMPYAGFSAGAVIAADRALVGGWQRHLGRGPRPVCAARRAEGLVPVTVEPGLGLVPFGVDVHGTQWGTLTRAVHVIDAGLLETCVLVDEDTALVVDGDEAVVHGQNHVYRVGQGPGGVEVGIFGAGDRLAVHP